MIDEKIVEYVMNSPENTNPSVLNSMLKSNKVQPDWNQNDSIAGDYIKNRPFYEGKGRKTLGEYRFLDVSTQYNDTYYVVDLPSSWTDIKNGDNITVEISYNYSPYTPYTNVPITMYYAGGGTYLFDYLGDQEGYPFKITSNKAYFTQSGTYHLRIYKEDADVIFTVPLKFLPIELTNHNHSGLYYRDVLCVAVNNTALSSVGLIDLGSQSGPWNNIYVKNSISLGRKLNTEIGLGSTAFGNYIEASGASSHAEGSYTTASGENSHAEGYYTKASSNNQHVQGKLNIEDSSNTYASIIGNGKNNSERSNAATVDWSGNAWYAGTIEGTALILPSSTANSTKKFKITVDDSGVITATEITTK